VYVHTFERLGNQSTNGLILFVSSSWDKTKHFNFYLGVAKCDFVQKSWKVSQNLVSKDNSEDYPVTVPPALTRRTAASEKKGRETNV